MTDYNKYIILYLTKNAQSRLGLTDQHIQAWRTTIDEEITNAEKKCWRYVHLINQEDTYLLIRHDEIRMFEVKSLDEQESTNQPESSEYSIIYLTNLGQKRLELIEDYIYASEYLIDEKTTNAEGNCWHHIRILNQRNVYMIVRHDEIKQIQFVTPTSSVETQNVLPSYQQVNDSACFIATACSTNLDELSSLYKFRDRYLANFSLGRKFIDFYYAFSPPIANVIRNSIVLKLLTRNFLIKPIVFLLDLFLVSKRT
jgi:hypothetical protein